MNLTVDPAKIRKEDTIPYRANTFGIALNTPNGVQGFHARRAAASLLRIHAATAAAPRLDQCRFGVRGFETGSEDLVLDAQLSINTPAFRQANPARAAHVDLPQKLFIGLYYLKPPADTGSQGGDLILCRPKSGQPLRMYQREVDAGSLEEFQRIRYGRSVLVLFLNGPRSVHAVSPRQPTPHTRRFLNLIGQAPRPLFDVTQYQMPRWLYLARLFRDRYIDPSEFGFGEQRL